MRVSKEEGEVIAEGEESDHSSPPSKGFTSIQEALQVITPNFNSKNSNVAAPPYPDPGEASASRIRRFHVDEQDVCSANGCKTWRVYIAKPIKNKKEPTFIRGPYWASWADKTKLAYGHTGHFLSGIADGVDNKGGGFTGPKLVTKSMKRKHLTIWSRFDSWAWIVTAEVNEQVHAYIALQVWVWPNGFQQRVTHSYDPEDLPPEAQ